MRHILFEENPNNEYSIALLIKDTSFTETHLEKKYVEPLVAKGIPKDSIIGINLKYNDQGKSPVSLIKKHLNDVLQACRALNTKTLLVADTAYFKTLTRERKAEPHFGYILPCKIPGYEDINVILSLNYQRLFFDPTLQDRLDMSLDTLFNHVNGTHTDLGLNIIHKAKYPVTNGDIQHDLMDLLKEPMLTCDIETFGLGITSGGIGTIAFAKNQHEGIAFAVDYEAVGTNPQGQPYVKSDGGYGFNFPNNFVREILLIFFEQYKGTLMFHNATFDIKHIIYNLFMEHDLDSKGLIHGLKVMCRSIEDTKIITYLATNSTAGNNLSLKHNAFEFAGNYAEEDIHDISRIQLPELLKYNLIDCLSTWYVYNKNNPIMVGDQQQHIYDEIMIPSITVITHMELVGMPMSEKAIGVLYRKLRYIINDETENLLASQTIKDFEWQQQAERMTMANLLLKKKVRSIDEFKEQFNPASNKQLQQLLYDHFDLPVIDTTDTGLPACGGKTLVKLLNNLKQQHNITEEELKL